MHLPSSFKAVLLFTLIGLFRFIVPLPSQATQPELSFQKWAYPEAMEVSPDGRFLLSIGNGSLQVWDARTSKQLYQLNDVVAYCNPPLWIAPDSSSFASNCSNDILSSAQNLRVWKMSSGQKIESTADLQIALNTPFDISPDGQYLAILQKVKEKNNFRIAIIDRKNNEIKQVIDNLAVLPEIIRFINQGRFLVFSMGIPEKRKFPLATQVRLKKIPI